MNSKKLIPVVFTVFCALVLSSCGDDDDSQPVDAAKWIPVRMEYPENSVELKFNDQDKVHNVIFRQEALNGVILESTTTFAYRADGKPASCTSGESFSYAYHYQGDRVDSTYEYIDDILVQIHTFSYNDKGLQ